MHESAIEDANIRFRHERFLVSRLATGAVMMAGLPPYLLWRGVPSGIEVLAIASLFLPVLAAAVLSRSGSLWIAHAISSAGLTGLIVCLAGLTGGVQSAATIWLVAVPLEAVVSGSKRATVAASLLAMAGVLGVALAGSWMIANPTVTLSASVAMPVFALTAIGHVAAQALELMRNEGRWHKRLRDNEARDRMLLAAIDDLVTWHDANGRVIEASASAEKLVGPTRCACAGTVFWSACMSATGPPISRRSATWPRSASRRPCNCASTSTRRLGAPTARS